VHHSAIGAIVISLTTGPSGTLLRHVVHRDEINWTLKNVLAGVDAKTLQLKE
jgi:hypothetical protein